MVNWGNMNTVNSISTLLIQHIRKALGQESRVLAAYIVGSVVTGQDVKDSDFDLAVVVENRHIVSHDHIYTLLQQISFPKNLDLSLVDKSSSPLFLFQIVSKGKLIYETFRQSTVEFEVYVLKNYYDTQRMRNTYHYYLKNKFGSTTYAH